MSGDSESLNLQKATFGTGCFWCSEPALKLLDGVVSVKSGYAGGKTENPSYEQVSEGNTGHVEAVQIEYDPKKVGYNDLLKIFWEIHDPTQANGQGADIGSQYQAVIFYHTKEQKELAEESMKEEAKKFKIPLMTQIRPFKIFYQAEEYHQNFYAKHPDAPYSISMIAPKIEKVWKERLTQEQYRVLRKKETEQPFTGAYLKNKEKGVYKCAACGAELFSSDTKFESGTGWPSFTEPANLEHIELREDLGQGMRRTEGLCKNCGSHLGHVFEDGPQDRGGKRYCINSVCLGFEKT